MAAGSPQPRIDHRRATAERNATAILDATERLLAGGTALSMRAIADEAGISRPTLYAHHRTIAEVVEAAVDRAVAASLAAIDAADPGAGPADEALERLAAASWGRLARYGAVAGGVAEHLPAGAIERSHRPIAKRVRRLVDRGRRDGTFRTDVPADWLVTLYFSLVHAADEHARAHRMKRERALAMLVTTLRDVFTTAGRAAT
jgi:TetR/AcrR family transcriptional regulator, mexCD-oprJ operon repressor